MFGLSFLDKCTYSFSYSLSIKQRIKYFTFISNTIIHWKVFILFYGFFSCNYGRKGFINNFCSNLYYFLVHLISLIHLTHQTHFISSFSIDKFRCKYISHRVNLSCDSSKPKNKQIFTFECLRFQEWVPNEVKEDQT